MGGAVLVGSTLAELRTGAAELITAAGVSAYGHVPERVTPPAAVVLPDEPYLSGEGVTMCGTFRARYRAVVLGGRGTNATAADELDRLITVVVQALDDPFEIKTVSEPAEVELNGAGYLGAVVTFEALTDVETTP